MTARPFVLARHEDPSGVSGLGIIAEGVVWTGGSADLHWMTDWESFVHWPGGLDDILAVHGHGGATVCRFLDEPEPQPSSSKYPDNSPYDDRD